MEAERRWRDLEAETGASLLAQVGIVNHGDHPEVDDVHAALGDAGIPSAFLTPEEAARCWPGIRFETRVLHTPTAGRLHADASVRALQQAAAARGADIRHETPVRAFACSGTTVSRS